MAGEYMLETKNISQVFGGIKALTDVSISVKPGEIFAIIGPNGAGKTTLFNAISGLAKASSGEVYFRGRKITRSKSFDIHKLGMARTFQNIRLFPQMTVKENIMVGDHDREKSGILSSVFRSKQYRVAERNCEKEAEKWMKFFNLYELRYQNPTSLPYGVQRKLEIARAMISNPHLLLLDEPAAGMNEVETLELRDDVRKLQKLGVTIILIEHDIRFVMSLSDHIAVLNHGCLLKIGTPEEVVNDTAVIDAYLGVEEDE